MNLLQPSRSRYGPCTGLTYTEMLVAIGLVAILAYLFLPRSACRPDHCNVIQGINNAKQLHLATQQMVLDGVTTGNSNLNWPGDTGGTFTNWSHQLVSNGYLRTNDFLKLMSAPGVVPPAGKMPKMEECALLLYAVSTDSVDSTVFTTSANFTNTPTGGSPPGKRSKPYGDKGFVIFRKAGDGAILRARDAGKTNVIGKYAPLCR